MLCVCQLYFLLKNKKKLDFIELFRVVRATGLEPAHRLTLEPNGDDTSVDYLISNLFTITAIYTIFIIIEVVITWIISFVYIRIYTR